MVNYSHEPWKTLYLIYQLITFLVFRLPFWLLISTPRFLRPCWEWTVTRCIQVRFVSFYENTSMAVGGIGKQHDYRAVDGPDGLWIEPIPKSLLVGFIGKLARENNVPLIQIPGYWQTKPSVRDIPLDAPAEPGEQVLLYLRGGAYVAFSAHPSQFLWAGPRGILQHSHSTLQRRAFAPEYRLSAGEPYTVATGAFPTALIDALAGYCHLLKRGFAPENITVVGDSAGANLAIALVRYIVDNSRGDDLLGNPIADDGLEFPSPLRVPGALVLISPWADLGTSHDAPVPSYFERTDYIYTLDCARTQYAQRVYCGALGLGGANTCLYISPASKYIDKVSFKGFPRTFISCGGEEALADSIRMLHKRMSVDMDGGQSQLVYHEAPYATHDYVCMDWQEPERTETLKIIAAWMENR